MKNAIRPAVRVAVLALAFSPAAARPVPASAAAGGEDVVLEGWVYEVEPTLVIRGETDPAGTVVSSRPLSWRRELRIGAYLRTAGDARALSDAGGRFCLLRGVLHDDEIVVGGNVLPRRAHDVLDVKDLRAFHDPLDLRPPLRGAILRDLFARGVDYARDGTPAPADGLSPDGRLPDGRRARVVPLVTPPRDSADMYTEVAYVDPYGRRYWAVRGGGFVGVVQWVGPFDLPRPGSRRRAAR